MDGQHNSTKSELKFLERLSIEELETLLRFSGDPADVEMLSDTIIEEVVVRERKNPTGRLPDVDAAWDEFQMMCQNMPDGEMLPFPSTEEEVSVSAGENGSVPLSTSVADKPSRIYFLKVFRIAAVMAAAVVLSLALMVGVQAAGVDVFGTLARWTDDTFHFETRSAEPTYCEVLHDTIQEILDAQGVLGEYVPTWYPEDYDIASVKTSEDALGMSIDITLLNETGSAFFIRIEQYKQNQYIDPQIFETDNDSVEKHSSNGKVYYIFSNKDSITASWSNGISMQTIWGELDKNSIRHMIDSIGG